MERREVSFFQKHLLNILCSVILIALMWVMNSASKMQIELVQVRVEIAALQEKIDYRMRDRFTGTEGKALSYRVDSLERKLEKHCDKPEGEGH